MRKATWPLPLLSIDRGPSTCRAGAQIVLHRRMHELHGAVVFFAAVLLAWRFFVAFQPSHIKRTTKRRTLTQCRMLTARAITRSEVSRAETLWMLMRSFARVDSGIVSVGLNAVEFVTDT